MTDEDLKEYLVDAMLWVNAMISTAEDLSMRVLLRNQIFKGSLRQTFWLYRDINYEPLTRQCELFKQDLEADAEMLGNSRQLCISQLGSWTLAQLATPLEGDEGLRAMLLQLNALCESERSKYVAILNGIMAQLILMQRGLEPECSIHPPLDYDNLLKAVSASEKHQQAQRSLQSTQAQLMKKELEWSDERKKLQNLLEDAEIRVRSREKELVTQKGEVDKKLRVLETQLVEAKEEAVKAKEFKQHVHSKHR